MKNKFLFGVLSAILLLFAFSLHSVASTDSTEKPKSVIESFEIVPQGVLAIQSITTPLDGMIAIDNLTATNKIYSSGEWVIYGDRYTLKLVKESDFEFSTDLVLQLQTIVTPSNQGISIILPDEPERAGSSCSAWYLSVSGGSLYAVRTCGNELGIWEEKRKL